MFGAVTSDCRCLDQHVLGLAAIGSGVHAQRAADGAGNAEQEFEAADIRRRRCFRDALVKRGRACGHDVTLGARLAETARRQANDDAGQAAIANDEIGANTDAIDRNVAAQMAQEMREVFFIGRREQHLRRTADAKPRQRRQRFIRQ